jgi:integrase
MAKAKRGKAYRRWFVRQRGESWTAAAKVPGRAKYEMRTFKGSGAYSRACAWAETRAAELRLGLGVEDQVAGAPVRRASVAVLGPAMVVDMRKEGLSDGHIHHLEVMLSAWATAVPDLASPAAGEQVAGWYAQQEVAPNTYNRYLMQGRRFVHWCQRHGHLPAGRDPLSALRPRRVPKVIKEQFTVEEARHLLHQVDDRFQPLFAFLIYTGARIAEVLAVRWEDLELDRHGGGVVLFRQRTRGTHKTGERVVPLSPELRVLLEVRRGAMGERVFTYYRGTINRTFSAFLAAHGLDRPGLTPHSCRHTFCGLMTATGEPTALVAQWVGHSGEKQTLHYAALAARQRGSVEGWARGTLPLLEGWAEPVRRVEAAAGGRMAKMRRTLRSAR